MRENTNDFARFVAADPLPWASMDTNEALRQRALRLIAQGVNQKKLAERMGLSQAAFSRWINQKSRPVPITALDGLDAFVKDLMAAVGEESQRSVAVAETRATGTAGGAFQPSDRRHVSIGPPPGIPDRRR